MGSWLFEWWGVLSERGEGGGESSGMHVIVCLWKELGWNVSWDNGKGICFLADWMGGGSI